MSGGSKGKGLIPKDLYAELPRFVDKKTLVEYMKSIESNSNSIAEDLRRTYQSKLKPFEEAYRLRALHLDPIEDAYFTSRPIILLIGQYSSGKSTFVKHLIDKDYPGIRIGPEPTTDKFVAVMYNQESSIIPGNALVIDQSKPFKPLIKFGNKFLNRFQASLVDSSVLKGMTIIDSPGILTDSKSGNEYDYQGVIEWFAQQADRIFLFVDANKLELSGTFQQILQMIRAYDDKLRIVLNKTDLVKEQELIRIYGALMWFLGQTLDLKEVIQIYIGSFWGQPVKVEANRRLYEAEEFRIFEDLSNLPRESLLRKANYLVKRAQGISIQAYILGVLRERYRKVVFRHFMKQRTKRRYIKKLPKIYTKIEKEHNITKEDFPEPQELQPLLIGLDWNKFKKPSYSLFKNKEQFINEDIPELIAKINLGKAQSIFTVDESPFSFDRGEGFDEGSLEDAKAWVVDRCRSQYEPVFHALKNKQGKVSAANAKVHMMKSNLPSKVLSKIWVLADMDQDGMLDFQEFLLAMYLISIKIKNPDEEVPTELPRHLIPPNKRQ